MFNHAAEFPDCHPQHFFRPRKTACTVLPGTDATQALPSLVSYQFGPQTQPVRKGMRNNLAQKCLAGMLQFLNSTNFLFRIFNAIGQVLLQFSKFLSSTVYSPPIISQLGRWLAEVMFFLSSTLTEAFQRSRHFQARQTLPHTYPLTGHYLSHT